MALRMISYGYKMVNGILTVNDEEARVVVEIFQRYGAGEILKAIADDLTERGVIFYQEKNVWNKNMIARIIENKKYIGEDGYPAIVSDEDYERAYNLKSQKGVKNNHPAIISKETFKLVQAEIARRSSKRKTSDLSITEQGKYSGKFALTEILVCGECGSPYRRKTWVIKGEKKRVWRCLNRVEHGTQYCKGGITIEEQIAE